jgi:two-component system, cell cycle sensor histidine kinase and response regulator CckA
MPITYRALVVNDLPALPDRIEELHRLCFEESVLLDLVTDGIILWTLHGRIRFWNRSAEKIYGWLATEVLGQQLGDICDRGDREQYQIATTEVLKHGEWQGEFHLTTREGKPIMVSSRWYLLTALHGTSPSIVRIDTDITEKKLLENQFLRAQRLENLGTLASGIAHDLNNILTPIVAIAELLHFKLPNLDERTQKLLETLAENAKRGRELVAQILSFARGSDGEHTSVQVRHLLSEVLQVARQTFPKSIEISLQVETTNLWTVLADATQLHQILMNLCINARDAMPRGGRLTILAENLIFDDRSALLYPDARPGAYVSMTVADTGIGIAPENLERIFEAFFTTKALGKGTGLGLSTVSTIVKNHHGFVHVSSQLHRGTQFRVYLPAVEEMPKDVIKPDLTNLTGNNELILIVDDEPSIREILGTTLEAYHYQTMEAEDEGQAIELYTQHHHNICAILLDYMMPASNPKTTIAQLQQINPHVPIIVMSGLSPQEIDVYSQDLTVTNFLPKPFGTYDLLNTLKLSTQL